MELFFKTLSLILPGCSAQICPGLSSVSLWKLYDTGPVPLKQPAGLGLQAFHSLRGDKIFLCICKNPDKGAYTRRLIILIVTV